MLMVDEQREQVELAEIEWKNQLFLHRPDLYKKYYVDVRAEDPNGQFVLPKTMGEVAEVLDQLKQAGGPDLNFEYTEDDNDWSFVEKIKARANSDDHTHDTTGEVGAFDALDTQDIDD